MVGWLHYDTLSDTHMNTMMEFGRRDFLESDMLAWHRPILAHVYVMYLKAAGL